MAEGKRDFFISFNKADRAWATWIAWALEEAGYSVFFQDWDFKGNFILEMDKAHTQSRRTIAALSPDYLTSHFTAPEWTARFAQDATSEHDLLIPVRVRPCELEGLLAQIVYIDLIGCGEPVARERLLRRVEGIRLKPNEPPLFPGEVNHDAVPKRPAFPVAVQTPTDLIDLPYPGLRAFTPEEAPIFYGRGQEVERLIGRLRDRDRHFIAIVGDNGTGKSSLVYAGLVPRHLPLMQSKVRQHGPLSTANPDT